MGGRGVRNLWLAGAVLIALALLVVPASASAETFKVKNEKDSGPGSLRQAMADTNDGDLVKVPRGHYEVKSPLSVATDIEIRGAGSKKTVIDGRKKNQVFVVAALADTQLTKLAVTGGKGQVGGGINSAGTLVLDQVLVEKNKAAAPFGRTYGAAIASENGDIEIRRSEISHNSSVSKDDLAIGGAIYFSGSVSVSLSIDRSEISNNTAKGIGGYGGAITFTPGHSSGVSDLAISQSTLAGNRALGTEDVAYSGVLYYEPFANNPGSSTTLTIENATIANNLARSENAPATAGALGLTPSAVGGAFASQNIASSTIAGNEADGTSSEAGGILLSAAGAPVISNTIVAGNKADTGTEGCSGPTNSIGANLETEDTCSFDDSNDIVPANPKLGELKKNGGPTPTMAIPGNSPALDEGISGPCPPTDQRGVDRPQGPFCDVGAFEREQ